MTKEQTLLWINEYIEAQRNNWQDPTLRSERYRLGALAEVIDGNPDKLLNAINGQAPYSRTTTWSRVAAFWSWLTERGYVAQGENPYKFFRRRNNRLFANAYVKKPSLFTFEEIQGKVMEIGHEGVREKALELLQTGMRYHESIGVKDGRITGKGGKIRKLYGKKSEKAWDGSYQNFYKHLRRVGLKPHDLRKAFASQLAKNGVGPYDLCAVMGWSDIGTALSYVREMKDEELEGFIHKITKRPKGKNDKK